MKSLGKFLAILLLYFSPNCLLQAQNFAPEEGNHVVLLGNTFADRMQYYNYFEVLLQKAYPEKKLIIRNMGWSADEPNLMPRPLNFGSVHDHLSDQQADIIFLCFGMNESFKGPDSLTAYISHLTGFIEDLRTHKYNGNTPPKLILVSPIAHENLNGYLPDPSVHNKNLAMYSAAMKKLAGEAQIGYIDLFDVSAKRMDNKSQPVTINGIHLNDAGYREAAYWMAKSLGFEEKVQSIDFDSPEMQKFRHVIDLKNQQFFYRWRAVNGEYIYGRRKEPFGVKNFPAEMQKLDKMTSDLENIVWQMAANPTSAAYDQVEDIVDETEKAPLESQGNLGAGSAQSPSAAGLGPYPATTEQFEVEAGFEINLFASEQQFPLEKPVYINFDSKGRMWVALIPSYPHYFPGSPPNDRIVVLEDTNKDGKADKHSVFADKLYLPLSFEFWNDGLLVSAEPNLIFLKDTDGDGKADQKEYILHGFGTEDSHHALHTFQFGQDGAMYWSEGTFLHTQVETPYGPVRGSYGATYRFEPRTGKLFNYISYPYNNPWGNIFDYWGMHIIGDASDGSNYFAPPLTSQIDYPKSHPRMRYFTDTKVRPTAGIEFIKSRQFPDSVQGNFLVNNTIGFQGTKQYKISREGSGIWGTETVPMLFSKDPNFRPVDLKFGPDGTLYLVDWFNPLIGHMQHSLRDPRRDHAHGRIWRIKYKAKDALPATDLSGLAPQQLLDQLKVYEDRLRYRARSAIRQKNPKEFIKEVEKWVSAQSATDSAYEHHLLEALWIYQDYDIVNEKLLSQLLSAKSPKARTAAIRTTQYWRDRLPNAQQIFTEKAEDDDPEVRLQAVVGLSYLKTEASVKSLLKARKKPLDRFLGYAINETAKSLKPVWLAAFAKNPEFISNEDGAGFLLGFASIAELNAIPKSTSVLRAIASNRESSLKARKTTIESLAALEKKSQPEALLSLIDDISETDTSETGFTDLVNMLLAEKNAISVKEIGALEKVAQNSADTLARKVALAALLSADAHAENRLSKAANKEDELLDYLRSTALLHNSEVSHNLKDKIRELAGASASSKVQEEAIRALGYVSRNDATTVDFLTKFIRPNPGAKEIPNLWAASESLGQLADTELGKHARQITEAIVSTAKTIPQSSWTEPWFDNLTSLGLRTVSLLPESEQGDQAFFLKSTGTLRLEIATLPAKMLFDIDSIVLPAGRPVDISFSNPDEMPHNLVIITGGSLEKVGKAADAMAADPQGFQKNFVPDMPEVLYATPLLNPGENRHLTFTAPEKPGVYEFVCTFPGHWMIMKGIIIVKKVDS